MATLMVTITKDGIRVSALQALLEKQYGKDAVGVVEKVKRVVSRADRLSEAESQASSAKDEVEALRDELQEWLDNLPENLQQGMKAAELQEAIDSLDSISSELDGIDWSVSFPGMF